MILIYEFLAFGLDKLAQACADNDYRVILFTENPDYYQNHQVKAIEVVHIDTKNPKLVIEYINNHFDISLIKGIINSTDMFCLFGAQIAQAFNLVSNSIETLTTVRNKALLRNKCAGLDLLNVKSTQVKSFAQLKEFFLAINKPIIFKNASGTGSQDIYKIANQQDLLAREPNFQDEEKQWVAEEFIHGVLYSAESISYNGKHQLLGISSRTLSHDPLFQETSSSFPAMLPKQITQSISYYITTLLDGVNFSHGFTHIEFMLRNNRPVLIEFNPRLGGCLTGEMLCATLGQNIYRNMLNACLGHNCFFEQLIFSGGASIALLYAPTTGKIKSITGTDIISEFQDSKYYPVKTVASNILFATDQRANYGVVYAFDLNTYLAFNKAQAIANYISIELE